MLPPRSALAGALLIAACSPHDEQAHVEVSAVTTAPTGLCPASSRTIAVTPGSSVQAALNTAAPGDTVLVRAGVHHESIAFPRSGAATGCIVLAGEPGAILDGAGAGNVGITIASKSWVAVVGLTVRGYRGGETPMGISVSGSGEAIELRDNLVEKIESNANAHGIAFYGTGSAPLSRILVDGNEVRGCKLGQSESMVFNGNVTDFVVSRNKVHDNDNIGIDFIGFEGTGPSGSDQARSGVCVDNVVYNISSAQNPTYHGERSADGIYVDGGRDIVIERNRVTNADVGIEIASEHHGKTTKVITVRNNFVAGSYQGNVMIGGYDAQRGNAEDVAVLNNTLYRGGSGEVVLQYNARSITVRNNVFSGKSGLAYIVSTGANNTGVTVDNNLYFGASTSLAGSWADAHAKFANPLLVNAPSDLHLQDGSPAIDAGLDLGALAGDRDVDGEARVQGVRIDLGADEK